MEILERVIEYFKSSVESFAELIENLISNIKKMPENIRQQRNQHAFQENCYTHNQRASLSFSVKDTLDLIGNYYSEIRSGVAPLGYILLGTVPFIFLYQYSISHIRISEKLIIFFTVVIAALLNISLTGLAFFPVAALMFFSMWESNIIIASITVILLIIVCAETGDKKISKYLFPISIMILTGCSSDTGVYLTVAILFVCSLLWSRSLFTILTPLFLLINIIIGGNKLNLISLDRMNVMERVNLFNISINDYVKVVFNTTVSLDKSFNSLVTLFKTNYAIYICLFFGLYYVSKVFQFIVRIFKIDSRKFKYVIISHLYCSITFWLVLQLAHFAYSANIVVATLKQTGQEIKLLYSFNNLLEIMPMIMETAKSSNFVLIAISDIVIAFLLSIPISLFVGGYDK